MKAFSSSTTFSSSFESFTHLKRFGKAPIYYARDSRLNRTVGFMLVFQVIMFVKNE